jgi:hypothetical protein
MDHMFGSATCFNQPLADWNVSSVTRLTNIDAYKYCWRGFVQHEHVQYTISSALVAFHTFLRDGLESELMASSKVNKASITVLPNGSNKRRRRHGGATED